MPIWKPQISKKFTSADEAWRFWVFYGGQMGFNIRKVYENKSKVDKIITSGRYVCSKEGFRPEDKSGELANPCDETRTGCQVRMGILFDRISNTKGEGNKENTRPQQSVEATPNWFQADEYPVSYMHLLMD